MGFALKKGFIYFWEESKYDGIPLGYNIINYFTSLVFGFHSLKILSLLFSLIFLFQVSYYFFKKESLSIALFTIAIISCSNAFNLHLGEIRPYTLLLILASANLYIIVKNDFFKQQVNLKDYTLIIALSSIGLWVHHVYIAILASQFLYLFLKNRRHKTVLICLLKASLIVAIISAMSFYNLLTMHHFFKSQWAFIPSPSGHLLSDFSPVFKSLFSFLGINHFTIGFVYISLFSWIKFKRITKNNRIINFLVFQGTFYLITIYIISMVSQSLLFPRYNLYFFLIAVLLLVTMITSLTVKKTFVNLATCFILISALFDKSSFKLDIYQRRSNWNTVIKQLKNEDAICFVKMDRTLDQLTRALATISQVEKPIYVEDDSSLCKDGQILKIWGPSSISQAKGKHLFKPNQLVTIEFSKI